MKNIFVIALAILALTSCKKKDDDADKSTLIVKNWNLNQYLKDGVDNTSSTSTTTWNIKSGGSYSKAVTGTAGTKNTSGSWVLQNSDSEIKTTETGSGTVETLTILSLTSSSLNVSKTAFGVTQEYRYVPK